MNPMIMRAPEGAKRVPPCSSCLHPAQAVWIDQWGTVPLCDACCDFREQSYRAWLEKQKGEEK
jgi:hypothetical protein